MGEQTNISVDSKELTQLDCIHCKKTLKHKRITIKSLLIEGINVLFNLERGFLFTLKMLITKPSVMLKDYLDGEKRYLYYNPFRLAFILVSLSLFIYISSGLMDEVLKAQTTNSASFSDQQFGELMKKYAHVLALITVPFIGFGTFLVFKRLNYAEHLVACFYMFAVSSLIGIFLFPIYYFNPGFYKAQQLISSVVILTFLTYMFKGTFKLSLGKTFLKSLLALLIGIISFMLFTGVIVIGILVSKKLLG